MANVPEPISKSSREFAELQGKRPLAPRIIAGMAVAFLVFFLFMCWAGIRGFSREEALKLRAGLLESGDLRVQSVEDFYSEADDFLSRYASKPQRLLFSRYAYVLHDAIVAGLLNHRPGQVLSLLEGLVVQCCAAFQRVGFWVIAWAPLWLLIVAFAHLLAGRKSRVHLGTDLLGQTGNGRLYFSGSRFDMSSANKEGYPEFQVRGLATLPQETDSVLRQSKFFTILSHYQALNRSTQDLAAMLLKQPNMPAFLPHREDLAVFNVAYRGATLAEQALFILEETLFLHRQFRQGEIQQKPEHPPEQREPWSPSEYARSVGYCFLRVLTPRFRQAMAEVTPAEVAAAVLGLACGRVMSTSLQGGNQWHRASPFPQLGARAVLHSLPAFATEFTAAQRTTIRQALVYASRESLFAPVRFPVNMSVSARALRSWMELLMQEPQNLFTMCDEVELQALGYEAHQAWNQAFTDKLFQTGSGIREESFVSQQETVFIPLRRLLNTAAAAGFSSLYGRIDFLAARVNETGSTVQEAAADADNAEYVRIQRDRVLSPLTAHEIEVLSSLHGLSMDEVRAWSALRIVLHQYGWLARRVGDYSVPPHSLILSVFSFHDADRPQVIQLFPRLANVSRLGLKGMVPLRAMHLRGRWGPRYLKAFLPVQRAWMAEQDDDFQRLMRGMLTKAEEEAQALGNE